MPAKYAPAALLPWAGALPFDWMFVPFLLVALLAAWMTRAGQRVAAGDDGPEIRRDLLVSVLLGLGNALLAAVAIAQFDLNYLEGMGVCFFLALGGIETAKIGWGSARRGWGWLVDRWFESEGERRQQDARAKAQRKAQGVAERTDELTRLARKLDEGKDDERTS